MLSTTEAEYMTLSEVVKELKFIVQLLQIHCWNRTKFACNTNLTPLMPGPYSQYVFKYLHKGTQKEDSQTYDKVFTIIEKILT